MKFSSFDGVIAVERTVALTKLIDLSQSIYEGIPVYPGDPLFESRPFADHDSDGYRGSRYTVGSHLGTHLDAPYHFFVDGETLDSFPVEFFMGSCACLNLAPVAGPDSPRYRGRRDLTRPCALSVADLAPYEPVIESVPILILRTGWSPRAGFTAYYDDFPSLSPDVCDWLADYPNLRILGLETPSVAALPGADAESDAPDAPDEPETKERKPKFDPELREFLPPLPDAQLPADSAPEPAAASDAPAFAAPPLDEVELLADAECHRILLGRRPPILILEGLVNLDQLPQYCAGAPDAAPLVPEPKLRFELSCFPLAIKGADGSPTRVVARIPDA